MDSCQISPSISIWSVLRAFVQDNNRENTGAQGESLSQDGIFQFDVIS